MTTNTIAKQIPIITHNQVASDSLAGDRKGFVGAGEVEVIGDGGGGFMLLQSSVWIAVFNICTKAMPSLLYEFMKAFISTWELKKKLMLKNCRRYMREKI